MKKFTFLLLLSTILVMASTCSINAQSSRNGYYLTVKGEIRILVVYLQIDYTQNPQLDPTGSTHHAIWPVNGLPNWKDNLLDTGAVTNFTGEVTKYFDDASIGIYKVFGDYLDTIFTISDSNLTGSRSQMLFKIRQQLVSQLNGFSFQTKNNLPYSKFDLWQNNNNEGEDKINAPDNPGSIDHVMLLIRNFHALGSSSGSASSGSLASSGSWISDSYSNFNATVGLPIGITTHEYGHMLYGGNEYHTVGRGGSNSSDGWTFMHPTGGYSGMSSSGYIALSVNAWDRYKLGWRPSSTTYPIRASQILISPPYEYHQEVNSDIEEEGDLTPDGIYLLKDFVETGDALRIKLPYLKSGTGNSQVNDQWLWIENRQGSSNSSINLDINAPKGIYAYIQVGKEDTAIYEGNANYLHFLPAIGAYDLDIQLQPNVPRKDAVDTIDLRTEMNNPFTGYHHLMQSPYDIQDDGVLNRKEIKTANDTFPPDIIFPHRMKRNGILQTSSMISTTKAVLGSDFDAFTDESGWRKIGIGYNPAIVPVMTYYTEDASLPSSSPDSSDNRTIHLNGLSIEVIEERQNGDIEVKVRFDDYDVVNNLRWCGDIILREKVYLKPNKTITIDQGYMAQKPVYPQLLNGEKVFADPTKFTMKEGSEFTIEESATLIVKGGSEFIMNGYGTSLDVDAQGIIKVMDSSVLRIKSQSILMLSKNAKLELYDDAILYVDSGQLDVWDSASVVLYDNSKIILEDSSRLTIRSGGYFEIGEYAEVLVKSKNAISVGNYRTPPSQPSTAYPAELNVLGALTFEECDWIVDRKDGFYTFSGGADLNIDSGYNVSLKGINPDTKILNIGGGFGLNIENRNVIIEDALIRMWSNSSGIHTSIGDVDMEDITLDGGTFYAYAVSSFDAIRFDVKNCETAFNLSNINSTINNLKIWFTDFDSTVENGIVAQYVDEIFVSDITSKASKTTLYVNRSDEVRFKGDVSESERSALVMNDVYACYLMSPTTDIYYCDTAIKMINSQVFLRNGAKLTDNYIGIYCNGDYDENAGAFKSLLTVGDVGCGELINHPEYGYPIKGFNTVLNIDAELHAAVGGNGFAINPNSFYNNADYTICNEYDPMVQKDTIPAKGNYWYPQTYAVTTNLKSTGPNQCNYKPKYVILDTTNQSTCTPTGSGCMTCGTRDLSGLATNDALVFGAFGDAYAYFVNDDSYNTRSNFASLANLAILKDTMGEFPAWKVIELVPGEDTVEVSNESIHLVMVAKALYLARTAPPGAKLKPETWDPIFADYLKEKDLRIKLSPNPTNGSVLIEKLDEDPLQYYVNIYNAKGQLLIEGKSFLNKLRLDVSDFKVKGIYFVEIYNMEGSKRVVEKLIYE